ncbi:hypothetical protein J7E50_18055 [Pedobacter sp. ISL-68]|uniref:hypothetical protein n=1 Tax=unclassified Pedobacter TaxID=2628915 RepID=UPI001BE6193D|nr:MULTISPECIES: hypothetical protein [unclassified Pedobacter]MBT2559828.1 hypothetical protein [Pedobacter sp. ISL-64]MBT2592133.1 hypothetical protein [Pedobacter sp. ISL-68]
MRKLIHILIIATCMFSFKICSGQDSPKYKEIEWKNGSEAAKKIMVSSFYYDPLDAWSPFGNDTGSDIYYLYSDWKNDHPNRNVREFLNEELVSSGYPWFDIYMDGKDPERLKRLVSTMTNQYIDLGRIDDKIISLAFTQLFLEGKIEPEVKKWAEAAFSREKIYLDFWNGEEGEKVEREKRMNQLLADLLKG